MVPGNKIRNSWALGSTVGYLRTSSKSGDFAQRGSLKFNVIKFNVVGLNHWLLANDFWPVKKSAVAVGGRQRLVQGLIWVQFKLLPFPKGGGFALGEDGGIETGRKPVHG